ncbi:hypothetical protein [Burkholderia ubonensis]|uniref:hypothetical protein n=1 Tax=Burkholderia ubonensis TaxID=101571 RepID=UPI000A934D9D|nr:hypothetical protein [Burkholderia ubonensis]
MERAARTGTAAHAIDPIAGSHSNHQAKCPAQLTYRLRRMPLHRSDSIHMKLKTAMTLALLAAPCLASAGKLDKSCTYKGIHLQGRVKVVKFHPDLKVRINKYFPDLYVQRVDIHPSECGRWKFVDSDYDFTIQYVDSFEDIEVKWTDSFPGVR